MKKMNLNEILNLQVRILQIVTKFCDEHNIRYFLYYGTLLGAVRHKGYIPWDDDIDIAIPRPDYEKFIQNFNGFHEDYEVFELSKNKEYLYPFAKVSCKKTQIIELSNINLDDLGINVDIFPLDGLPEPHDKQKELFRRIIIKRIIYSVKSIKLRSDRRLYKNAVLIVGKIIFYFFKLKKITSLINNEAFSYDFDQSSEVACLVEGNGAHEIMRKSYFDKSIQLEFEGNYYNAPLEYDKVLWKIYGDYMELPPINKRISHHDFKAYLK